MDRTFTITHITPFSSQRYYLVPSHNVLNFCTITNYVESNHVPECIDTVVYNPQHVYLCVRLSVCLVYLSFCVFACLSVYRGLFILSVKDESNPVTDY